MNHLTGRLLTTGNAMSAKAALDAGCRFFAGYPITPASEIFGAMTATLPGMGGLAVSAPDEISALALCIGASLRGVPSMTATSGPGWCLMVECFGYALMTETPLVVAVVQRLGPSTGAATQGAQGDIALVSGATSGAYTFPIFAPSTAAECYADTLRAFEWAERLRTPVVVLSDKEVSSTAEVVELGGLPAASGVVRTPWPGGEGFRTYGWNEESDVPPFAPVGGDEVVTVTGSAHDRAGLLKKNDPETLANLRHLQAKVDAVEAEIGLVDTDIPDGATTLVLSYGVSARASRDAVAQARREGGAVGFANVRTLFPVPRTALKEALRGIHTVVLPEENHGGQYRQALGGVLAGLDVRPVNRIGAAIKPSEILDALR